MVEFFATIDEQVAWLTAAHAQRHMEALLLIRHLPMRPDRRLGPNWGYWQRHQGLSLDSGTDLRQAFGAHSQERLQLYLRDAGREGGFVVDEKGEVDLAASAGVQANLATPDGSRLPMGGLGIENLRHYRQRGLDRTAAQDLYRHLLRALDRLCPHRVAPEWEVEAIRQGAKTRTPLAARLSTGALEFARQGGHLKGLVGHEYLRCRAAREKDCQGDRRAVADQAQHTAAGAPAGEGPPAGNTFFTPDRPVDQCRRPEFVWE